MAMRLIRQPDDNTCGVATVAMVAGVPFSAARKAMGWNEGEHDFTSLRMMLDALRSYGVVCGSRLKRGRKGLGALSGDAVINFDPVEGDAFQDTHWAVWDGARRKLLDPDSGTDRTSAPFRYLEISRPGKIWAAEISNGPTTESSGKLTVRRTGISLMVDVQKSQPGR